MCAGLEGPDENLVLWSISLSCAIGIRCTAVIAVRCIRKDTRVVLSPCLGFHRPRSSSQLLLSIAEASPTCSGQNVSSKGKSSCKAGISLHIRPRCLVSTIGWPIRTSRRPFLHSSSMQNPPRRLTIWCTMTNLREYPRSFFQLQSNTLEALHVLVYSPHKVSDYFQSYQTVVTDSYTRRRESGRKRV